MTRRYHLFGGILHSEVPLPGLPRGDAGGGPDWRLRRISALPDEGSAELLGRETLANDLAVELWRGTDGYLLRYGDTGAFRITGRGHRIDWLPGPRPVPEALAVDVAGRVLATALHARGVLTLHASAVALSGGAVAFLGPKGAGKSTLAAALLAEGARMMADDALPVEVEAGARARPGLPRLRLSGEAATHLAGPLRKGPGRTEGSPSRRNGTWSPALPSRLVQDEPLPLTAIYLLVPVAPRGTGAPVRRMPVPPPRPALALLAETKVGRLLGGPERPILLRRCSKLASRVPVWGLHVSSELDRVREAAARVAAWHGQGERSAP